MIARFWHKLTSYTAVKKFVKNVNKTAAAHGLDPKLPELVELKKLAPTIVVKDVPAWRLDMIDPNKNTSWSDEGVLHISERWFGYALYVWTIARYHVANLDTRLTRIVADGAGTHLFEGERLLVSIDGGAINPNRLADPGNRYEIACMVIKEFSGVEIGYKRLVGCAETITVVKQPNGSWTQDVTYVRQPA